MEELHLPKVLETICSFDGGLCCIAGPTGSGKSTTLAAMIDYINSNDSKHIIKLENPIEFVHHDKKSVVVHRDIGVHSNSLVCALKNAMRSDPDIILLGEVYDLETIRLALACAAMGILIFATFNTNGVPKTIDHIIDAFPAEEQSYIKTMLAEVLQGIVGQLLCKRADEEGRIAVHEILLRTEGLSNIIKEGQISNIQKTIESSKEIGMQSIDNTLKSLLSDGIISPQEAYMNATNKKEFAVLFENQ